VKNGYHLVTGSKVVLNRGLYTDKGRRWEEGTEGVVDAVYRKDGEQIVYVKLDGTVVAFDDVTVLEDSEAEDSDASKAWGVFEFATGVLWRINPETKEEADKTVSDFSGLGYHLAVPIEWGSHMSNAFAHGRFKGLKERRQ
jgi:hypothetical protein